VAELTDVQRRLVAVFAADVEGYSRLMGADEVGTPRALTERRTILDQAIADHRGRIANTAGDSVLAEFGSAVDAVQCALTAQPALTDANAALVPHTRINFRIGIEALRQYREALGTIENLERAEVSAHQALTNLLPDLGRALLEEEAPPLKHLFEIGSVAVLRSDEAWTELREAAAKLDAARLILASLEQQLGYIPGVSIAPGDPA
jgi:hypothetical protein